MTKYEVHPFADIFPLMSDEEFQRLCDDIRLNGQQQKIIVYQGKIADGRNREMACRAIGIEPLYEEWHGNGSLINFIVSVNLHRRMLNESQRAMVAAKLANLKRGQSKNNLNASDEAFVSQSDAGKLLNVSRASIQRAQSVSQNAVPEIVEQVERGEISVTEAERYAKLPKGKQKRLLKKGRNKLKEAAQKLLIQTIKTTKSKNKAVCLLCSPDIEATQDEFIVHLTALRGRVPEYARYIDPILSEISEMELSDPVREAKEKILAAVRLGLNLRKQIKTKTDLSDDILDGALAYLVEFGELEIVMQPKTTEAARGQLNQIYREPPIIDLLVKELCVDCDKPVGVGYKKLEFGDLLCKSCYRAEAKMAETVKNDYVAPTRDFRTVLGKYEFYDERGVALINYKTFDEVVKNAANFTDSFGMKLNKFRVFIGLMEEIGSE